MTQDLNRRRRIFALTVIAFSVTAASAAMAGSSGHGMEYAIPVKRTAGEVVDEPVPQKEMQ